MYYAADNRKDIYKYITGMLCIYKCPGTRITGMFIKIIDKEKERQYFTELYITKFRYEEDKSCLPYTLQSLRVMAILQ